MRSNGNTCVRFVSFRFVSSLRVKSQCIEMCVSVCVCVCIECTYSRRFGGVNTRVLAVYTELVTHSTRITVYGFIRFDAIRQTSVICLMCARMHAVHSMQLGFPNEYTYNFF